jgi:preprotein translocase subunit SecE
MADNIKLVLGAGLAVAGVAAYYWLGETALLVLRILAVAAGIAAGAAVALTSAQGREFLAFAREAVTEVKKVVWPTRKETMQTTAAVFAFVVVMAVFLWISDKTLEWVLYDLILGWKKTS